MKQLVVLAAGLLACAASIVPALGAGKPKPAHAADHDLFVSRAVTTTGSVTVEGHTIAYQAVAGTIIVHPKGWDDAAPPSGKATPGTPEGPPVASMFYVAYFKKGAASRTRPIMFLYNGGPGSSSIWLHMGAFGPVRVETRNDTHTPPAPYGMVRNAYSLLDASDLVFIDAPGTGYSRIEGKGKDKAFYGVDPDAHAFASFITHFLTKYDRWNSPKYLLGESYGTPRSAVLINELETSRDVDFNGVILLSQILNFDLSADDPGSNPGVELPYEVELPSMAATAWYHHLLANAPPLPELLKKVEHFAMGEYADALAEGASLPEPERQAIAEKLHEYTALPVGYLLKADLEVTGPQFEHELLNASDLTTGRLDTRFTGPSMDPLGENAEYDPQGAAISSAYVSTFNDYVRRVLHYRTRLSYIPLSYQVNGAWDLGHQAPGAPMKMPIATNVMPDLAAAMKYDPDLKIMLNGGYFDLGTPFYEGIYEMHHLQIPRSLQANISYHYYASGHMIYANLPSLEQLHDNVAAFVRQTDNVARH